MAQAAVSALTFTGKRESADGATNREGHPAQHLPNLLCENQRAQVVMLGV